MSGVVHPLHLYAFTPRTGWRVPPTACHCSLPDRQTRLVYTDWTHAAPSHHWKADRLQYSHQAPTEPIDLPQEPGHKHRLEEERRWQMKKCMAGRRAEVLYINVAFPAPIMCSYLVQNTINKSVHVCGLVLWVLSPVRELSHHRCSESRWRPTGRTNVWLRCIQRNSTAAWVNYITQNHTEWTIKMFFL